MKKIILLLLITLINSTVFGQNFNKETIRIEYTRMPLFPLSPEIKHFHYDLDLSNLNEYDKKSWALPHYEKALKFWTLSKLDNEGLKINVRLLPYETVYSSVTSEKTKKVDGEDVRIPLWATKIEYRYPLHYEVFLPDGTLILSKTLGKKFSIYHTGYSESKAGAENEAKSGVTTSDLFSLRQEILVKLSAEMGHHIRSGFDFSLANHGMNFYSVKKHKKYEYSGLNQAIEIAKDAFSNYDKKDTEMPSTCKEKLGEAMAIWKSEIAKHEPGNKKARINDKIAIKIYQNMFICYSLMHEFEKGEAIELQASKFGKKEPFEKRWVADNNDRKERYLANIRQSE